MIRQVSVPNPSSPNLLDHDSGIIRKDFPLNQRTDFARGVLFDSDSNGILDTVASPSRTQAWDLDAMGKRLSRCTNGTGQIRTTDVRNQVSGEGFRDTRFRRRRQLGERRSR